jgi:DNA polymerase-3 subunit gamma/tau
MSPQVFYRKWRPQTLKEVVGQEPVTRTLLNALSSGRVSHAYLFCGPRGTGKTSTGRILAKAINCTENGKGEPCNRCAICQAITEGRSLDVIEIDAASNTGVDDIRSLREKITFSPAEARRKVYIIDEVHMLSNSASNALLKTLEEPPPHAIFILATTEIHKVLPTIISRCQRFDFRRISQADLVKKLAYICEQEGIKAGTEALNLIAKSARGSFRDAENLLQQIATYYGSEITLNQVRETLGITGDARVKELVGHIISGDAAAGIGTIQRAAGDGLDLRQFNRELVANLRELLLVKTGAGEAAGLADAELNELKDLAAKASLPEILTAVKLFGRLENGFDQYSTLPLELALVDCVLAGSEAAGPAKPRTTQAAASPAPVKTPPPGAKTLSPTPSKMAAPPPPATETKPPVTQVIPEKKTTSSTSPPAVKPVPVTEIAEGDELSWLRANLKQLIEETPPEIRKTPAIGFLRSGAKVVSVTEKEVVLAFRYAVHKDQIEKPENRRIVEEILSRYLGRSCQVRCTCETEKDHLVRAVQNMGAQITSVEEK